MLGNVPISCSNADDDASGNAPRLDALRQFDWASTAAGPIERWSEPLKHAARLILLSAAPMAVLIGKEGLVAPNEAMRDLFGTRYDGSLGQPIEDMFPEAATFYRQAIDQCFEGIGSRFRDEPLRVYRDGAWTAAWFQLAFTPIADRDGNVSGVFLVASEPLADSERRFHALVESIPQIVWSTDHQARHDYFNSRWNEFTGLDAASVDGRTWEDLVHPEDWPRVAKCWGECVATGKPYDIEYRFLHHSGQYRWLRVMALPVHGSDGAIMRWYGTSTDIEGSKTIEMERELVANELEHRIRNLFALVNGLVTLSVRENAAFVPFADQLRHRLSALHVAHEFIRGRSPISERARSVQALARAILAPYDDGGRIVMRGNDAILRDHLVTPLALIFHELATNSAKYGALACDGGLLSLRFRCESGRIVLNWVETEVAAPGPEADGDGFGSKLLTLTIERQLKGKFSRVLTPGGLSFEMEIPA